MFWNKNFYQKCLVYCVNFFISSIGTQGNFSRDCTAHVIIWISNCSGLIGWANILSLVLLLCCPSMVTDSYQTWSCPLGLVVFVLVLDLLYILSCLSLTGRYRINWWNTILNFNFHICLAKLPLAHLCIRKWMCVFQT